MRRCPLGRLRTLARRRRPTRVAQLWWQRRLARLTATVAQTHRQLCGTTRLRRAASRTQPNTGQSHPRRTRARAPPSSTTAWRKRTQRLPGAATSVWLLKSMTHQNDSRRCRTIAAPTLRSSSLRRGVPTSERSHGTADVRRLSSEPRPLHQSRCDDPPTAAAAPPPRAHISRLYATQWRLSSLITQAS